MCTSKTARKTDRVLAFLLVLSLLFNLSPVFTLSTHAEETATPTDYWTDAGNYDTSWYNDSDMTFNISREEQLEGLAVLVNGGNNFSGKTVNLTASVDISLHKWTPIGTYTDSEARSFSGTFDGKNNVVDGIYINATTDFQGLFGYSDGGTIKNVGVTNGSITSTDYYVGGVVGYAEQYGTVSNC